MWRNLFAAVVLAGLATPALAQKDTGPFITVPPLTLALDRPGVWTLNFAYMPPRIVEVDTPQGKRWAWYMLYRVWNTGDTPQIFVPDFELVTKDGELRKFLDEPHASVFKQVRKIEDPSISAERPNGELNIQDSVSISKTKIPLTKPDSAPRAVYGVAIWMDVPVKAPTANNFSVYVGGLSNGLTVTEGDDKTETISKKTLRIDFFRPTDNAKPRADDIKVNDNNGLGAEQWIYRAIPAKKATPEEKK